MKTLVVHYSLTGNNKLLTEHVSGILKADTDKITVPGKVTGFTIFLDALLNRKPALAPPKFDPADYDLVVFIAPVWIGKVASPLRSYIEKYRSAIKNFAFLTISGEALGKNEKVPGELARLAGKHPVETRQLYINDILPDGEKPLLHRDGKSQHTDQPLPRCGLPK